MRDIFTPGDTISTDEQVDEQAEMDERDYDLLHDTAEAIASEINNQGADHQVAFLRHLGVSEADITSLDLDDLVIDAASVVASNHYNAGDTSAESLSAALAMPQD